MYPDLMRRQGKEAHAHPTCTHEKKLTDSTPPTSNMERQRCIAHALSGTAHHWSPHILTLPFSPERLIHYVNRKKRADWA
jgi:hypothetical protein